MADLAGISVEYYARLERGELKGATEEILGAIATALRLSKDERAHLFDLARGMRRPVAEPESKEQDTHFLRPGIRHMLDTIAAATLVVNFRTEILAANSLACALYADMFDGAHGPVNYARFVFCSPSARMLYLDWGAVADEVVATLHRASGSHSADTGLSNLVGQLATNSVGFQQRWDSQVVRQRSHGVKRIRHRGVGELELFYETLQLPTEPDLSVMVYGAEPGSTSADAVKLLPQWAARHTGVTSTYVAAGTVR